MTKDFYDRLKAFAGERANVTMHTDPRFTEKHEGRTPSGGDYCIAYYYDESGRLCVKSKASRVNIVEYTKDDKRINECYGVIG